LANFTTVSDLCDDALFMAGEDAAADVSPWYDRTPELLSAVQNALISGGGLADRSLAAIDWWWLRASARGKITVVNAVNADGDESGAFVYNSNTVALTPGTGGTSSLGAYLLINGRRDTTPVVIAPVPAPVDELNLNAVFPLASLTTTDWIAAHLDYALPNDFIRFTGALQMGRDPYKIEVTDPNTLEELYPLGNISPGTPKLAALVNESTLRFSHYLLDGPLDVTFEYVQSHTALARGGTPNIPHAHRRILSYGAAYLIMWEKRDRSRGEVFTLFSTAWDAMMADHYKQTMGPNFGQIIPRPTGRWGGPQRNAKGEIVG